MTLFDFSRQLGQFRKEKKYTEALSFFKANKTSFQKETISGNDYIISDMLTCLRQTNFNEAGFKFLDLYGIEIKENTSERILSAYGWLLWAQYRKENQSFLTQAEEDYHFVDEEDSLDQKDFHYTKSDLLYKIENLINYLLPLKNDFNSTLISNLFSIVLKTEKKKPSPNWKLVNDFCDSFDPAILSKKCDVIEITVKGQPKDMELASDFENWYAYKSKALMKLGLWQQCFEISREALNKIEHYHYSNDVWFSRRVALSKKNLGNTDETIQELQNILKKKKEWFIQKELAELYLEEGKIENAFNLSIAAINNFGPLIFKVDLLFIMGLIHQRKKELELAFKHFSLSRLIRLSEEWKIPQKLDNELTGSIFPAIPMTEIKSLKNELEKYWRSFKKNERVNNRSENLKGEIIKILHDNERGKDGFISSKGKQYYFSISSNFHLTPNIAVGSSVSFTLISDQKGPKAKIIKLE